MIGCTSRGQPGGFEHGEIMTTHTPSAAPVTTATDATPTKCMCMRPCPQIVAALTDDALIRRWWDRPRRGPSVTATTCGSFHGRRRSPRRFHDRPHSGNGVVTWAVTHAWNRTGSTPSPRSRCDGTATELPPSSSATSGCDPRLLCFDQCCAGWNHFMPSLHQFLETGEGRPNEPRDTSA